VPNTITHRIYGANAYSQLVFGLTYIDTRGSGIPLSLTFFLSRSKTLHRVSHYSPDEYPYLDKSVAALQTVPLVEQLPFVVAQLLGLSSLRIETIAQSKTAINCLTTNRPTV